MFYVVLLKKYDAHTRIWVHWISVLAIVVHQKTELESHLSHFIFNIRCVEYVVCGVSYLDR